VARKTQEGFPWHHRIVRASDYRSIYGTGQKVHAERLVLYGRENGLDHSRLGMTVSRRVGKAVVRNRVKRLLREIFRKSADDIPNHFDFIVNAKRACATADYLTLREEFLAAVRKLLR
jgi:ribonuclease P protein component